MKNLSLHCPLSFDRSRRTAWEVLLEMEKYNYSVEEVNQGAVTLVVVL